jgi:hypothetical protein
MHGEQFIGVGLLHSYPCICGVTVQDSIVVAFWANFESSLMCAQICCDKHFWLTARTFSSCGKPDVLFCTASIPREHAHTSIVTACSHTWHMIMRDTEALVTGCCVAWKSRQKIRAHHNHLHRTSVHTWCVDSLFVNAHNHLLQS